jgi:hypothetical protein
MSVVTPSLLKVILENKSTPAGISMFMAVPVMVWFALMFTAAKDSNREYRMPASPLTSMPSSKTSWGWRPVCWTRNTNRLPKNAPHSMMPSSAMLMTPLRSLNMPPSATSSSGMATGSVF